jgi:hypothetical protein
MKQVVIMVAMIIVGLVLFGVVGYGLSNGGLYSHTMSSGWKIARTGQLAESIPGWMYVYEGEDGYFETAEDYL